MPNLKPLQRVLTLLLLSTLLAGFAAKSLPSLPLSVVPPPMIPELPPEARQPPLPSICLPTCSAGLTSERESWRNTLIVPALPVPHANGYMTR